MWAWRTSPTVDLHWTCCEKFIVKFSKFLHSNCVFYCCCFQGEGVCICEINLMISLLQWRNVTPAESSCDGLLEERDAQMICAVFICCSIIYASSDLFCFPFSCFFLQAFVMFAFLMSLLFNSFSPKIKVYILYFIYLWYSYWSIQSVAWGQLHVTLEEKHDLAGAGYESSLM